VSIVAFPLDPAAGSPSYSGENVRQALSALLGLPPSGRPLGANSGVRPGSSGTLVSATSTTWTVAIHSGILDLETPTGAGGYFYALNTAQTGSMTAANATNPRIDLISLQVNDPAEGDGSSTPGVTVVYTTGTAAPSPAVPATPARNYALAQINVPTSGGGSPTVTQVYSAWNAASLAYVNGSNSAGTSIANNTATTMPVPTVSSQRNMTFSAGVATITVAGRYLVTGTATFSAIASPAGIRSANILINGSQASEAAGRGDAGLNIPLTVSWQGNLSVGDTVSLSVFQTQGAALALASAAKDNLFAVTRLGDS
jgi:hypothetical protein